MQNWFGIVETLLMVYVVSLVGFSLLKYNIRRSLNVPSVMDTRVFY
ncbi:MAG: hypothetical protein HYU64_07530 [Armatimonadetes bacterium]|nr:hypothetical protein [Armatimonadota bacterium]